MPLANNNPNPNPGPFERFFRGWLVRQEELRQLLLQATERDCDEEAGLQELIGRAVAHYAEYYKAHPSYNSDSLRVVREDVLILLPGFAFRLVTNYVTNLTEEQKQRMEQLRAETAEDERKLTAELSRVRTRPTAISLVEMATMARERVNGERDTVDERIEMMKLAAEILVECADYLRCKTALKIMGILNPSQNVKFLLAVTQLQRRVRNWRMEREAESSTDNSRH
ncbi:hypothetical protein AAG906_008328 [Vitis piasezkii]